MKAKDQILKEIEEKCGVSRKDLDTELGESLEYIKSTFPKLDEEKQSNKALKIIFEKYKKILKSGGVTCVGYVIGYDTASDRNSYVMTNAAKLLKENNPEKIKKFEEDYDVRISDNKVMRKTKDGREFELKTKIQRNVHGICKDTQGEWRRFTLYWAFNSLNEIKSPPLHTPVEFRGIPNPNEDGSLSIASVPETLFKHHKEAIPPLEELIKKVYSKPMTPADISKLESGSPVLIYTELHGYTPNPLYGDRFNIPIGDEFDLEADDIFVNIEKDITIDKVIGWAPTVPCLVFGTYKPYENRDHEMVKKIVCYGLYVMEKDRVAKTEQTTISKEETNKAQTDW